ncbi:hypothetical protein BKP37_06870 [Anaerobacillus alkalilacustris]|uniref:Uncharacterized protein n=1 Tax=Anaerobacillus alkalilacustris TaxID=393763 RepID=A0A1S2LSM5_9BACI|nr:hypothetical protein [Anaerobacillus alkalilacustris]OIJ15133.1 hypothetical protein BKP37_06870 [Anaerobacillus alkalilacustris]
MFNWVPNNEQDVCERRLRKVMKRLKVENFNFNYDRSSCYIDFHYQNKIYRLEHSIEKAKDKGLIMLRNGLDCLSELIDSLEDLCQIIQRGTYNLETWIAGMAQSASVEEIPNYVEELHIRYKPIGKQKSAEYDRHEEMTNIAPESYLEDFSRNQILQRTRGK